MVHWGQRIAAVLVRPCLVQLLVQPCDLLPKGFIVLLQLCILLCQPGHLLLQLCIAGPSDACQGRCLHRHLHHIGRGMKPESRAACSPLLYRHSAMLHSMMLHQ